MYCPGVVQIWNLDNEIICAYMCIYFHQLLPKNVFIHWQQDMQDFQVTFMRLAVH